MTDTVSYAGTTTEPPEDDGSGWSVATPIQVGQIFIGMLGVVGNLACVIVLRRHSVRNNTNLLIVNQAIVDCVTSGLLVASTLSDVSGIRSVKKSGVAAKVYCYLWNSLVLVFGGFAISTFNLVALSVERYLAVVHPIWYLQNFKKRAVHILIILTWVLGPIFQVLLVALHYDTTEEGTCSYTPRYTGILVMLFFWDYFLPACVMTFSFAAIMHKFRKLNQVASERGAGEFRKTRATFPIPSTSAYPAGSSDEEKSKHQPTENTEEHNGTAATADDLSPVEVVQKPEGNQLKVPGVINTREPSTTGDQNNATNNPKPSSSGQGNAPAAARPEKDAAGALQRRNTTKVLLAMYIIYLVCWSPNQWTFLQYNLGGYVDFSSAWYRFLVIMGNLNTCINPFLFALRLKAYRHEARAMYQSFISHFSRG